MSDPCTKEHDINEIKGIVHDIHKRLFVDNGVDSFQTSFRKGTARMDAQDVQLSAIRDQLKAHEERPKKILGIVAIVLPLALAVGGAIYKVTCFMIDHFQWRATP